LKASFPIDHGLLDEQLPMLWPNWDADNNGCVEFNELFAPRGLVAFVKENWLKGDDLYSAPPDIRLNKAGWFVFWDQDGGGTLSKHEVTRALIKTFNKQQSAATEIRNVLEFVWNIFDTDNSGEIDIEEFSCPDGLADSIIASCNHER